MKMGEPLISIIIPAHNVEGYLKRCVDSVLAQTLGQDRMEVILVDDLSTDHTPDLIREYEQNVSCVKAIYNEENLRQGGARNRGMEIAEGKYLGFVDSDDWIEPCMYEEMLKKALEYDCDLVNVLSVRSRKEEYLPSDAIPTGKEDRFLVIEDDRQRASVWADGIVRIGAWNAIFRKEMARKNRLTFAEHLIYEDLFWGSLWHLYVNRVYMMEKRLYHYYVRPDSTVLTKDDPKHFEFFSIQELLWEEYKNRGALDRCGKALEFDYLMNYYILGMKMLSLRYTRFPCERFYQMQSDILRKIPDWSQNPYIQTHTTEFQRLQFELLGNQLNEEELELLAGNIRQIYGEK